MRRGKTIGTAAGAALVAYFLILPIFWSFTEPHAAITIPNAWQHNVDLPIHIRVTNAHPNFTIQEVRVTFNYAPADGQGTPYPRILHQLPRKKNWNIFKVNRFTWPCSDDLDVTLPLAELARDNGVRPGILKGEIQVTVDYVDDLGPNSSAMGTLLGSSRTIATPYELALE